MFMEENLENTEVKEDNKNICNPIIPRDSHY